MIIKQNGIIAISVIISVTLISLTTLILLLGGNLSIKGNKDGAEVIIKKESPSKVLLTTKDCIVGEEKGHAIECISE